MPAVRGAGAGLYLGVTSPTTHGGRLATILPRLVPGVNVRPCTSVVHPRTDGGLPFALAPW